MFIDREMAVELGIFTLWKIATMQKEKEVDLS